MIYSKMSTNVSNFHINGYLPWMLRLRDLSAGSMASTALAIVVKNVSLSSN